MAHGGASFFPGASGIQMGDIQYFEASHVSVHTGGIVGDRSIDGGWELLLRNAAPNALPNSSARYDAPKCDEDTRVEVTAEIMGWIEDRNAPQRLLCMTGVAGSGKSALQQTIAERCANPDIVAATFFFSSTDPTRNKASTVAATIAYQLGLKHPLFQSAIAAAVKHDPLIFSQSLQSQMDGLIVRPFKNLRRRKEIDVDAFPYAILIDGLDECKGEPNVTAGPTHVDVDDRHQAEDRQAELLAAIKHCLLDKDLLFRVFITSRPEWAIRTALEPRGYLREVAYHIQLSDQYDASADMGRYLRRRFEDIGLRIDDSEWFSEADIETLVRAASGQFIYVATVYKYISERRASPVERLKIVLTWTPREGQATRPFEALDRLYTNILLAAKNAYEAVDSHHGRDFLLFFRAHHISGRGFRLSTPFISLHVPTEVLSTLLGLGTRAEDGLVSDLRSLVTFERSQGGFLNLHLYHKSFSDFLDEETRAKDLFVPQSRVVTHLAKCCIQHIIECPLDFGSLPAKWDELPLSVLRRSSLKETVEDLPLFLDSAPALTDDEIVGFTRNGGWQKINNLLPLLYRSGGWFFDQFEDWIRFLDRFAGDLKARKPEVATVISEFVEKWKCDAKEWPVN
ncbi:hypothetical protein EST38_g10295 [Candolleomyces aberdarensis]|uniref:Nephrocystin 3-like N-terminal domain-containing protein n=1 Tax=Candolleomyces aberdarensis TaxID=2316362 RepID=A0A4Q2D7R4_9AGAR|nr:hypothetical protein EST38_g10295 [Candolleomyces aberdarensis]